MPALPAPTFRTTVEVARTPACPARAAGSPLRAHRRAISPYAQREVISLEAAAALPAKRAEYRRRQTQAPAWRALLADEERRQQRETEQRASRVVQVPAAHRHVEVAAYAFADQPVVAVTREQRK